MGEFSMFQTRALIFGEGEGLTISTAFTVFSIENISVVCCIKQAVDQLWISFRREGSIYDLTTETIMVGFIKLFSMAKKVTWSIFYLLERVNHSSLSLICYSYRNNR